MTAFSCFLASILRVRRSAHCALVTSEWQATQRVRMFSSLHSPAEFSNTIKFEKQKLNLITNLKWKQKEFLMQVQSQIQ